MSAAETLADSERPVVQWSVGVADLESVVHDLAATSGVRLADLFAENGPNGQTILRMVWALDAAGRYLIIETQVDGVEYPALSDIAPAAFIEECEIYEQFALRPAGDKPLNRIATPPHDGTLPRLGRIPTDPPGDVHAPHHVGGHAFEFPFGPVRATGVESLYYGLVTSGEEVVDLYLFTWHKHRGLEWRLVGMRPDRALFLVERAEGLSAIGNAWAFAMAAESELGLEISAEAARTRAVALELERLYNHAAAIAAMCQATGLSVGQANAEIALERCLRLNAAVFGHRYLFGVVAIGGVNRDPDIGAMREGLPGAYAELRRVIAALSKTNSFLDRLEACGIVSGEDARQLGLVGPIARASGVDIDSRRDHSSAPFDANPPRVAGRCSGDAMTRFQTMIDEIDESRRLLEQMTSVSDTPRADFASAGAGLGWAESSRGESLAWMRLDGSGRITRARLRPAAVRNWRAFDDAARSQNVFTDIPIIEASFWLTVAGMAR